MGNVTLPILGAEGWVSDPDILMTRLWAHSFLTDHSQSNIYQGHISSLQYLISENAQQPSELAESIRLMYHTYYSAYFSDVVVRCLRSDFLEAGADFTEAAVNFDISVTGYLKGTQYTLSKILMVDTSDSTARFTDALENN